MPKQKPAARPGGLPEDIPSLFGGATDDHGAHVFDEDRAESERWRGSWATANHYAAKLGIVEPFRYRNEAVPSEHLAAHTAARKTERSQRTQNIMRALALDFGRSDLVEPAGTEPPREAAWALVAAVFRAECERQGLVPPPHKKRRKRGQPPKVVPGEKIIVEGWRDFKARNPRPTYADFAALLNRKHGINVFERVLTAGDVKLAVDRRKKTPLAPD